MWEFSWTVSFRALPAQKGVEKFLSIGDVFLSCENQPVSPWLELLGVMSSGLWSLEEAGLSINARELLDVEYGLRFFAPQISNSMVALFADNSTAISFLHNQGGTRSPLLNSITQRILRWAVLLPVVLAPQFIMGLNNVLADSLSRPNQI